MVADHPLPEAPSAVTGSASVGHGLLRILADGRSHAICDLARDTCGSCGPDERAVVEREIEALRAVGLPMRVAADAVQATAFVPLDRQAIADRLRIERSRPEGPGWTTRVVHATASTNSALLEEVRWHDAWTGPLLLAAEVQQAGRGRLGRAWDSAPGASLTVSFALRVDRRLSQLDGVTLACGLAVHDVLVGLGVSASLKWPNDVLVAGRKLAGILVEVHSTGSRTILVIGVGLNVAARAAVDDASATNHLQACLGERPDRNVLAARLAVAIEARLARFAIDGFGPMAAQWNAADAYRDEVVRLSSTLGATIEGTARGVDAGGALLVDVHGIRQRIIAGDVSLRPLAKRSPIEARR